MTTYSALRKEFEQYRKSGDIKNMLRVNNLMIEIERGVARTTKPWCNYKSSQ